MDDQQRQELPGWVTATVMALAVVILVIVFIWTFIEIDPLLSDFIPTDSLAPTASPVTPTP